MKTVFHKALEREVSVLGFGTASMGSRVSRSDGQRAVALALDLGITWFDTAPPYGDGEAEAALGQALSAKRTNVVICSKFGIEPPKISPVKRLLRPLARQAVKHLPNVRGRISQARAVGETKPIDRANIRLSVERSLRRLKTDYIDVLALHEPSIGDASDPEIFDILAKIQRDGLVRTFSIAGAAEAAEAGLRTSPLISTAQFPDSLFNTKTRELLAALAKQGRFCVTHSIMSGQQIQNATTIFEARPELADRCASAFGLAVGSKAAHLLLAYALANNANGTVIMSMFSPANLRQNVDIATRARAPAELGDLQTQILSGDGR